MLGGRRTIKDYQTIAEIVDMVLERREPRPANPTGWLSAAGRGQVDGAITIGDVIVCGGIIVGFTFAGTMITATSIVTGLDWSNSAYFIRDFTRVGAYFALGRLTLDALDLYRFSGEILERAIEKWREKGPPDVKEIIRTVPVHYGAAPEPDRSYLLPNGQEIPWPDLTGFLRYAAEHNDRTDGKSWSREYWCHPPDHPDRPGIGQLKTRQWAGIKQLCIDAAGEYPVFRAGLWRTNDGVLVEQFIELLEER